MYSDHSIHWCSLSILLTKLYLTSSVLPRRRSVVFNLQCLEPCYPDCGASRSLQVPQVQTFGSRGMVAINTVTAPHQPNFQVLWAKWCGFIHWVELGYSQSGRPDQACAGPGLGQWAWSSMQGPESMGQIVPLHWPHIGFSPLTNPMPCIRPVDQPGTTHLAHSLERLGTAVVGNFYKCSATLSAPIAANVFCFSLYMIRK